jgi:hypothetical protein
MGLVGESCISITKASIYHANKALLICFFKPINYY